MVHPDAPGLSLPVRRDRLVLAAGPCLAALQHPDHRLLSGGCARSLPPLQLPRDLQHRSGLSIHQRCVHGVAQDAPHPDQQGRQSLATFPPRVPSPTSSTELYSFRIKSWQVNTNRNNDQLTATGRAPLIQAHFLSKQAGPPLSCTPAWRWNWLWK